MELPNESTLEEIQIPLFSSTSWNFYKQGKTIVSWFAKDTKRTTITRNVNSQDNASSIPVDAYPIKLINKDLFYIM